MKVFKLNKIKYKNIMSVGQKPIEIILDSTHKTLITGYNGAGKSTMIEAITFALFGKPFRDIKKGQLVNTFNKKNMVVELWMEYNGNSFYIKRGLKPNVFEIEKDGKKLDESASVKDFQEYFESLIGMTYSSFKQVVVLGTAGYTPFMSLTAGARRKLVEDLLGVSTIAEMDKINKSLIREINSNISVIDTKKDGIIQQIKIYKENEEKQKKLSSENINRFKAIYDECANEARSIKKEIDKETNALTSIILEDNPSDDLNEIVKKIYQSESKIASYKKVINLYDSGGMCPTCLQQLESGSPLITKVNTKLNECIHTSESLESHREHLATLVNEYNAVVSKQKKLSNSIAEKKIALASAVNKAKKIKAIMQKSEDEVIDYSVQIDKLNEDCNIISDIRAESIMEKYHRGILTDMLKDSGVKSIIINKYIPMFNQQINHYLKIMEADYVFTLNNEFSETIKSRGREEFSYSSFSQGEKARIDTALLFTWRNIAEKVSGVKINCLFLDEIFDGSTDAEGIKGINTILDTLDDNNIFIISHRDHDPQKYGKHIQMKKVGRFTVL